MIISGKKGNIYNGFVSAKPLDPIYLEWYETNKRILHKRTVNGTEIICKFLNESPALKEGDVLEENECLIVVKILLCDAIVLYLDSKMEFASVSYEIGNKHLPLFYEDENLLVPYDEPLFRMLTAQGYKVEKQEKKLVNQVKTTVSPHGDAASNSLFSRILKITATSNIS